MLYTNNERSAREIKEIILFTMASKRIKYIHKINLPVEAKDLYYNNKTLMKKLKTTKQMERHTVFLDWKKSILLK